jgi:hypothetical protein
MLYHTLLTLASTYGSGNYSDSSYNGAAASASTGGGSLSDTGIAIASIVTAAAVILLAAIVIRIWRRPKKVAEPVEIDDSNTIDDLNR